MKEKILNLTAVLSLFIVVTSKLFPVISCQWEHQVCDKWNELWFGLSCSYLAAWIFYLFTTLIPQMKFKKAIKPILKVKIDFVVNVYNDVFKQFGGIGNISAKNDDTLQELLVSKNWSDKIGENCTTYGAIVQAALNESKQILTELLSYRNYLSQQQIILIESLNNVVYIGCDIVRNCKTNSKDSQQILFLGGSAVLAVMIEDSIRRDFVRNTFIPSYRKLLQSQREFD